MFLKKNKKNFHIEFEVPCYYYLNIPILYGEGIVFFFFYKLKKLIGAKREGMLDVW